MLFEAWVSATNLGSRAEQRLILFEHDLAPVVHGNDPEHGPSLLGDHLPRDDVGMMLERREDDFVARLEKLLAIGLRNEVDALGRSADEDDFLSGRRSQKRLNLLPRLLERVGGPSGERVRSAMNVGVVVGVEVAKWRRSRSAASASWRRCRARQAVCRAPVGEEPENLYEWQGHRAGAGRSAAPIVRQPPVAFDARRLPEWRSARPWDPDPSRGSVARTRVALRKHRFCLSVE